MSSSMHVYGKLRPPGNVTDRVPTTRRAVAGVNAPWAAPVGCTRVELPAPGTWAPPNPALVRSLTVAPLRLAPVSWAPPRNSASPWGPPVQPTLALAGSDQGVTDVQRARGRGRLIMWTTMAVLAGAAATAAVIAATF